MSAATPDAVLEAAVADGTVPGAVAGVTDARGTIWLSAVGSLGTGHPAAMQIDSLFRIASMTKLVTTIAVLQLVEAGHVELDGRLVDYLPAYRQPEVLESFDPATRRYTTRPAAGFITIRQLLSHTSGYGAWFLDPPLFALTDGTPDLLNPPFLMTDPGTRFAYGASTDMLGRLVEHVSGRSLGAIFAERIFAPLGMHDTGFELPADSGRLAQLHARTQDGFSAVANETSGNAPRGGGGLYSSAHDYLCLLRMLLNRGTYGGGTLLSVASVDALATNQIGSLTAERQTTACPARTNDFFFMDGTQKFGLGVLIDTIDHDGGRAAGSYGWGGIFNTWFWLDPRAGLAGLIMMQLQPFCDPACVELYRRFERAVYARLAA